MFLKENTLENKQLVFKNIIYFCLDGVFNSRGNFFGNGISNFIGIILEMVQLVGYRETI